MLMLTCAVILAAVAAMLSAVAVFVSVAVLLCVLGRAGVLVFKWERWKLPWRKPPKIEEEYFA